MRVLFLTNRLPGALTRGDQVRAFEQIRHLSARHAITLLCFDRAPPDAAALRRLETLCERVVLAPRAALGMALRGGAALFGRRPLQVAMHDGVPRGAGLETLLSQSRFDLAHVQTARLGGLLPMLAPLPCVVDLVDALSLNMARRAAIERGPMRWVAALEARRMRRFEQLLCERADAVAVSGDADIAAIGARANLVRIDNGVDADSFAFQTSEDDARDIVFIGNLGYFPNIDAASWFAREVLPTLRRTLPQTRLRLVGARPASVLRRLAATCDGVDLIGEVPDVRPHLHGAAVAVVPMRAGSGTQLKMLEAMASGTAVVATSLAADAVGAVDGEHVLIADDADSMAAACADLLRDPARRLRLALAARALVEARWSWARSADALERVWMDAAARRAAVV